ncbi:MAG: hypothetical protein JNM07_12505 [Phycisphaerae bacterium]|nr:hypothetical protein [Phycisphaerae bacterium]
MARPVQVPGGAEQVGEGNCRPKRAGEDRPEDRRAELGEVEHGMDAGSRETGSLGHRHNRGLGPQKFAAPREGEANGADGVVARDRAAIGRDRRQQVVTIGVQEHAAAVVAFDLDAEREGEMLAAIFDLGREGACRDRVGTVVAFAAAIYTSFMSPRPRRAPAPSPSAPDITSVSPERRAAGAVLINQMQALDHAPDTPAVMSRRERLREEAKKLGLQLKSFSISVEPIPDPLIDALPAAEREAIERVHQAMYAQPAAQVEKLRGLIAKHPQIPVLRNHLYSALMTREEHDEAERVLAACVREFPDYLFGVCNYAIFLLQEGRLAEARALLETGPRGPRFNLFDFDPARVVFHISEALAFGCAAGIYMSATGRREAAKIQFAMLLDLSPEGPQTVALAAAMPQSDVHAVLQDWAARMVQREQARRAARPKHAKKATPTEATTPKARATGSHTEFANRTKSASPNRAATAAAKPGVNKDGNQGLFGSRS